MKNRIPADVRHLLTNDTEFKKQGRGSSQVIVRNDDNIAFTKWYDNKPVLFLSSVEANIESDECRRWCKKTKVYVTVPRPRVVRQYNQKMGGVDLADRLLAVCPYRYRTRKWTQRFFASMVDLAISNSWIQYKQDQLKALVPLKKIQQLRAFKMELGEYFIEAYCDTNTEATDSEEDNRPLVRRTGSKSVPVPNDKFRTTGAKHLPYMAEKVDKPGTVVVSLAELLLDEGRILIADNYYTSIPLARYLKERKTDFCGTVRKARRELPPQVIQQKLEKGQIAAQQNECVT
ncbi:unnamed protein product [Parnassius apollo]|uniref:(apollo) hypothetical protein n=1 Tax=Parnassius apollo TaxID=110799 RepID=A0A8S3WUY2_PARAO|nr:unnamed protein product [Parnassius apollo]